MDEFAASVVINRPVEQVFAFAENPTNMPVWCVGVQEATPLGGGAVAAGSKVWGVGTHLGKRIEAISTVVAYEVNRKATHEFTKPFPQTMHNTYEPVNGGTRVTMRTVVEAEGFFKLAMPVMMGTLRRNVETGLGNLKDIIEAQGQG